MPLTTTDQVKIQAGIPLSNTAIDGQLQALINGVSALVEKFLNRKLSQADYVEFYSGDNSKILQLRQYPIISVASVFVDNGGYFGQAPNSYGTPTQLVQGVDFSIMQGQYGLGSSGRLLRINNVWYGRSVRYTGLLANQPPVPAGNIKVSYTAGYADADMPADIVMGINAAIAKFTLSAVAGGEATQMAYEDANVTFADPASAQKIFGSIRQILSLYRMPVV